MTTATIPTTYRHHPARGWQQSTARGPDSYNDPSIIPFKAGARRGIVEQGYRILLNVGDQESDLAGGWAERTYKLPNPMYLIP